MEVRVRDTGVGIAAGDLPRVFDRSCCADAARTRDPGGTRLGLGIACWISVKHGGAIDLAGILGRGTKVSSRLPTAA